MTLLLSIGNAPAIGVTAVAQVVLEYDLPNSIALAIFSFSSIEAPPRLTFLCGQYSNTEAPYLPL